MQLLKLWRQNLKLWFARSLYKNKLKMFSNGSTKFPYYLRQYTLMNTVQVSYALQSIVISQSMQWHRYPLLNRHRNTKTGIIFLKYGPNLLHKNLNVIYVTRVHFLNSLSVHKPNNIWSTNYAIRSWFHLLLSLRPIISSINLKITIFFYSPCKISAWIATTCFTIMYKNKYNSKSKTIFLLLSFISEILGELKQKQNEGKWRRQVRVDRVFFFTKLPSLNMY